MQAGRFEVHPILEGTFLLDGGSMFGIVPKPLWSKHHPPDDANRIVMALRPLLIRSEDRVILVDCGIGNRFDARQQKIYQYQSTYGAGLLETLMQHKIPPDAVTDIIATHLHFDHVGGVLERCPDGTLTPRFPNATIHLQEECWNWARNPSAWDKGSYFSGDFEIWEKELSLNLLRGDCTLFEDVRVVSICGHTPGHQIAVIGKGSGSIAYCADLIPTAAHLNLPYIMAYDHNPLKTLEEKKILLAQALEEDWVLAFEHDPGISTCRLEERNGKVVVRSL